MPHLAYTLSRTKVVVMRSPRVTPPQAARAAIPSFLALVRASPRIIPMIAHPTTIPH